MIKKTCLAFLTGLLLHCWVVPTIHAAPTKITLINDTTHSETIKLRYVLPNKKRLFYRLSNRLFLAPFCLNLPAERDFTETTFTLEAGDVYLFTEPLAKNIGAILIEPESNRPLRAKIFKRSHDTLFLSSI